MWFKNSNADIQWKFQKYNNKQSNRYETYDFVIVCF